MKIEIFYYHLKAPIKSEMFITSLILKYKPSKLKNKRFLIKMFTLFFLLKNTNLALNNARFILKI